MGNWLNQTYPGEAPKLTENLRAKQARQMGFPSSSSSSSSSSPPPPSLSAIRKREEEEEKKYG
jgi:hypothetical protein